MGRPVVERTCVYIYATGLCHNNEDEDMETNV